MFTLVQKTHIMIR